MLDRFALKSVLSKVADGDRGAFATLYQDRSDHLYALTLRMLGDENRASEALQNTFVEIWREAQVGQADWAMPDLEMIRIARTMAGELARRTPDRPSAQQSTEMANAVNEGIASFELLELLQILGQISAIGRETITLGFYEWPTRAELGAHLGISDDDLTGSLRRCYAEYKAASTEKTVAVDRDADVTALLQALGVAPVSGGASQPALRCAWEIRLAPLAELLKPVAAPENCFDGVMQRVIADVSTTSGHANARTAEIWRAFLYVGIAIVAAVLIYLGLVAFSDDAAALDMLTSQETSDD